MTHEVLSVLLHVLSEDVPFHSACVCQLLCSVLKKASAVTWTLFFSRCTLTLEAVDSARTLGPSRQTVPGAVPSHPDFQSFPPPATGHQKAE